MNDRSSNNSFYDTTIKLLLFLGIIVWCFLILEPFAGIILWSLIIAIAFSRVHVRLSKKTGPKLASFIIVFSILIIIIFPTGLIINELIDEVKAAKVSYDEGILKIPTPPENVKDWPIIGNKIYDIWYTASNNLEHIFINYKDQLLELGGNLLSGVINAASGLVQLIISLCIAGVLLARVGIGEAIRKFFRKASGKLGDEIADLIIKTVGSVVKGVIGEAMILALMNGILFLLAGVPYTGIWTLLVFVFATLQIPVFFVTVPIMIYFFAVMELMPAIIWTILLLLVSFSDNFLTPLMLGKNAPVPMPVIFIGVIGGCILSGFIGIFTGAIVISVGYTLLIKWINTDNAKSQE